MSNSPRYGPRTLKAYRELQEDYEDRRNGRQYDESLLGSTSFMDVDNPIEHDPQFRKEVFSEMGAALKQSLNEVRSKPGSERVFVERSRPSTPNAPGSVHEARSRMIQARRQQLGLPDNEYDDDDWEDDDPYGNDDRYPEPRPRRANRARSLEDLEPVSPVYDEDEYEEEDDVDDDPPRYRNREYNPDRYEDRRSVRRNERNLAARSEYRSDQRPRSVPTPNRSRPATNRAAERQPSEARRYPPSMPRRQSDGVPRRAPHPSQYAPRPVEAPRRASEARRGAEENRAPRPDVAPQRRSPAAVRPSRPEFLGPDGRIPKNPCGAPLYVTVQGQRLIIECHEERRADGPPWHAGMPHIARIDDPHMNAENACFIWYYQQEFPGANA